jgi:hypothetical protein
MKPKKSFIKIQLFFLDPVNYHATLSILSTSLAAYTNIVNYMTFTLDSFDNVSLIYTLESSPMDFLVVNAQTVPTTKCNASSYPNLNCLQTTSNILPLTKCQSMYQISMGMGFNDPSGVLSTLVTTKSFNANLSFLCKLNFQYTVKPRLI